MSALRGITALGAAWIDAACLGLWPWKTRLSGAAAAWASYRVVRHATVAGAGQR
jgi:hypothetical protein